MTTGTISPLRQRMIEDMNARNLSEGTQRGHIRACKRFAVFLKRSPDTAVADDIRRFQLHLMEDGASIQTRNRTMTGVRFLFRITLRRHDLAAEVYHIKEPLNLPLTLSPGEAMRLLTVAGASSLRLRLMLALAYGCGLRAGEVARLKAGDIDSAQGVIRVVQSKGRKDRHVMLPEEVLELLRQVEGAADALRCGRSAAGAPGFSLTQDWQAAEYTPAQPSLPSGLRSRGHREARHLAFAAAQLRHASSGARHGHSFDSGGSGPRQARHDGALHARRHGPDRGHREPAQRQEKAARKKGKAA